METDFAECHSKVTRLLETRLQSTGLKKFGYSSVDKQIFFDALSIKLALKSQDSFFEEERSVVNNTTVSEVTVGDTRNGRESVEEDIKGSASVGKTGASIDCGGSRKRKTSQEKSTAPKSVPPRCKWTTSRGYEVCDVDVTVKLIFPDTEVEFYSYWFWWLYSKTCLKVKDVFKGMKGFDDDTNTLSFSTSYYRKVSLDEYTLLRNKTSRRGQPVTASRDTLSM